MRQFLCVSVTVLDLASASTGMASVSVTAISQGSNNGVAPQDVTGDHNIAYSYMSCGADQPTSTLVLVGNSNEARIEQNGRDNASRSFRGDWNRGKVMQGPGTYSSNNATQTQIGNHNSATITQSQYATTATSDLTGKYITRSQTQYHFASNQGATVASGNGNIITQMQGYQSEGGQVAYIDIGGNNNTVQQSQGSYSTGKSARTEIYGSNNFTSIDQDGAAYGGPALQVISSDRNTAIIGQSGTFKSATQRQH